MTGPLAPIKGYLDCMLFNLKELIFIAMLLQRILYPLHDSENFLFLQPLANDLYGHWKAVHRVRIVVFVRPLSYTIQVLEAKVRGQLVQIFIYMCDWNDSACVIELKNRSVEKVALGVIFTYQIK